MSAPRERARNNRAILRRMVRRLGRGGTRGFQTEAGPTPRQRLSGRALRWATTQFALIVAGVLVALAVDASRERMREAARERAYLAQLSIDLNKTLANIDSAVSGDRRSARRADQMLRFLRSSEATLPLQDSIDIWSRPGYAVFVPVRGTLDLLVRTPESGVIRDDALKREIITYAAVTDHVLNQLDIVIRNYWDSGSAVTFRLEPYSRWSGSWSDSTSEPTRAWRIHEMRSDPELRAAYHRIRITLTNHIYYLNMLRDATERLQKTLPRSGSMRIGSQGGDV